MSQEQRQFFRMDDEIELYYNVMRRDANGNIYPADENSEDNPEIDERFFKVMTEIKRIDLDNKHHFEKIGNEYPLISTYFRAMNNKIDALSKLFLTRKRGPSAYVNLSAGGVGFFAEDKIAIGTPISLRLLLYPSWHGVVAIGECVHYQKMDEGDHPPSEAYRISVKFTEISEDDEQAIMQHLFAKQSQDIRESKENKAQ